MKGCKLGVKAIKKLISRKTQSKIRRIVTGWVGKTILVIVLGYAIFLLGDYFGSGRLSLSGWTTESKNLPTKLDFSSVNEVYNLLKDNYNGKLTTSQLIDGLDSGLAQSTNDPYTEYFNPAAAKQFNNELQGTFSGIGAELSQNSQGYIVVVSPINGSPAANAGLKPQDVIATINGVNTSSMTVDAAVTAIRGPAGTKVTLQVVRNNSQQLSFTITRANITVPSVTNSILTGNIGYMQISQFTADTGKLAQQGAQQFVSSHVKGVVLDLRDNPGGEVDAAVAVSSLWLDQNKMILQEKRGSTVIQTYMSTGNDLLKGIPTVVLINSGSASASEITAGALHDNGAAELIGEKSFGKGVVQELFTLTSGGELKVTIASWYRPDGQDINKLGITPDQVVDLTDAQVKNNQDPQKDAAITWIQQH